MSELDKLLELLDSHDDTIRHEAVSALGKITDERAITRLVELLKDPHPLIKDEAVNSLVRIGDESVVDAVVPLLYSNEVYVRNISLEILSRLGEVSIKSLTNLLDEEDVDVLKFVIDIIGLIGSHDPVPEMISLLKHPNANIRSAVAVTFGNIHATEAIDPLVEGLSDDDEWVRFSILEALGSIGGPEITEKLLDIFRAIDVSRIAALDALSMLAAPEDCEKVMHILASPGVSHILSVDTVVKFVERFTGHISDSDKSIFLEILSGKLHEADLYEQHDILRGLAILGDSGAIDTLLLFAVTKYYQEDTRILLKDAIIASSDTDKIVNAIRDYPEQILVFVEALSEMKDPGTVAVMNEVLQKSTDTRVRNVVVEGLGNINTTECFEPLLAVLSDSDSKIRKTGVRALAALGDERAVGPLFDLATSEQYNDVIEVIGEAINTFSDDSVLVPAIDLLKNDSEKLRVVAAECLSGRFCDGAKGALETSLKDKEAPVRSAAIRSLATFEGEEIPALIASAFGDCEKEVRLSALEVLAARSDSDNFIITALSDEDMWVRFKAVNIIGEKKLEDAEGKLIELLGSDLVPVKISSARALGTLGAKAAVEPLKAFIDHEDQNLKEAAIQAIEQCEAV